MPRLVAQQLAPQLVGVLARRRRDLVEEALGDEGVLRDPHRPPEAPGHRKEIDRHLIHQEIGDGVRQVRRTVDQRPVDALVERPELEEDGRRHDAVRPGHRGARGIETRRELVVRCRAIEPVLHVVLARPDHFHRGAHGLGYPHRLRDEVRLEPAPEPAAQEGGVDGHLLFRQAGELRRHFLRPRLILRGRPDIAAVGAHVRRAVHRLHRRVMQERHLVHRLHPLRCRGERGGRIAVLARLHAGPLGALYELRPDTVGVERRGCVFVPLDFQGAAPLHGVPVGIGDHRDSRGTPCRPGAACTGPGTRLERYDRVDAWEGLRLRRVVAFQCASEYGTPLDRRDQHPRHLDVDPEHGAAVHLHRGVEPRRPRAEQAEVFRVLERHLGGHGELGGAGCELAVGEPALRGGVDHGALLGAARGAVHVPRRRRRADQQLARRGARLAQRVPRGADRRAAAGGHAARPARGILGHRPEPHLRPICLQLLGEDHRETGLRSLAHLGLVHGQRDDVVRADPQPGVGGEPRVRGIGPRVAAMRGEIEGNDEAGARLDEFAAGDTGTHDAISAHDSLAAHDPLRGVRTD